MKEKVLYLNILAAEGVTKQLLRSERIFLLDHLQNQTLTIKQVKAKLSSPYCISLSSLFFTSKCSGGDERIAIGAIKYI